MEVMQAGLIRVGNFCNSLEYPNFECECSFLTFLVPKGLA